MIELNRFPLYFFCRYVVPRMSDSEPIEDDTVEHKDFYGICFAGLGSIRYKYYILLFLLFLFVTSNIFAISFLTQFQSAVSLGQVTVWGTIIQAVSFIAGAMFIDFLTAQEII